MFREKSLKELNLMDRFLFAEAMEDPEFLETVLQIILGEEIKLIDPPQTEKEVRSKIFRKQVRLDVWAEDEEGRIYDAEVQKLNTKNLPRRTRHYHNLIGAQLLQPGQIDYNKLNPVYVIMITPFDIFGKGRFVYSFRMQCTQDPQVHLQDGTTTIFLNTHGSQAEDVSEELIALLQYFEHTTTEIAEQSGSARLQLLNQKVDAIRASEEIGVKYMLEWEEKLLFEQKGREEGREEGVEEGIAIGREQTQMEIARKLLAGGAEEYLILASTGITKEQLEAIKNE